MRLIRHDAAPVHLELELIDLDADDTPTAEVQRDLDGEELARAARLHGARHRRRFLLRRMHVRRRLGVWLGCDPAAVAFAYGVAGKPRLRAGDGGFSVAHSNGHLLIALVRHGRVGCDLEWIDPRFDWRAAARADVLTPREIGLLNAQAAPDLFFDLWTLKEAALKCDGRGLTAPARSVEVCGSSQFEDDRGRLHGARLRLKPDYAAAVAWT